MHHNPGQMPHRNEREQRNYEHNDPLSLANKDDSLRDGTDNGKEYQEPTEHWDSSANDFINTSSAAFATSSGIETYGKNHAEYQEQQTDREALSSTVIVDI